MSMISGLIDELNKSADEWNASNMFELARMCREAADTIWELRDDLQRANDAVRDAEHDESRAWDRVRKAEAENRKLRNLIDGFKHKRKQNVDHTHDDRGIGIEKLQRRICDTDRHQNFI